MADDIQVRVAGRSFSYRGETYGHDEELSVNEATLENHPNTLKRVDDAADSEDEDDAFDPSDHNLDELEDALEGVEASADDLHEREADGRDRGGAHEIIDSVVEG